MPLSPLGMKSKDFILNIIYILAPAHAGAN